jgi:hypothetical protein
LYALSLMPHGTRRSDAYAICRRTAPSQVSSSTVYGNDRMTSTGIRYSNMLPLHETSAVAPAARVSVRPSRNQCSTGTWFRATARKLASRASDASRS